jgi:hypothetical protein
LVFLSIASHACRGVCAFLHRLCPVYPPSPQIHKPLLDDYVKLIPEEVYCIFHLSLCTPYGVRSSKYSKNFHNSLVFSPCSLRARLSGVAG